MNKELENWLDKKSYYKDLAERKAHPYGSWYYDEKAYDEISHELTMFEQVKKELVEKIDQKSTIAEKENNMLEEMFHNGDVDDFLPMNVSVDEI